MEDPAHFAGSQQQIGRLVIRNEKAEAIGMAHDAPTNQVRLIHRGIDPTTIGLCLTVTDHRTQAATEGLCLIFVNKAKVGGDLIGRQGLLAVNQKLKNQLPAWNRVFVPLGFTAGVGVLPSRLGHRNFLHGWPLATK